MFATPTIICVNSCWNHKPGDSWKDGNTTLIFNQYHADAALVVDAKHPRSELSRRFPPEARVWLHIEPINLTEYFADFEKYYGAGILSWHQPLRTLPQYVDFHNTSRGISQNFDPYQPKIFGVGGLFSAKQMPGMDGHQLRNSILDSQQDIRVPSVVHNYRKSWQGVSHDYPRPSADEALDYMFCLAIENNRETGYFSEKLIRCFAGMTVPLYFGDPDITDVFDQQGLILIKEKNWRRIVNSLTPEDYYNRMDAIRRNYFRARKYFSKKERIIAGLAALPAVNSNIQKTIFESSSRPCKPDYVSLNAVNDKQFVVTNSQDGSTIVINASTAIILGLANGHRTASDLCDMVSVQFEPSQQEQIQADVIACISDLAGKGYIQYDHAADTGISLIPILPSDMTLEPQGDTYNLITSKGQVTLNASAAFVVGLCDGRQNLSEIANEVAQTAGLPVTDVEESVIGTLAKLSDQGFVNMQNSSTEHSGTPDLIPGRGRTKPRIMYLLTRYPQLSETYIKHEIEALQEDYDLKVVAFTDSAIKFVNHYPYEVIPVRGDTMSDELEDIDDRLLRAINDFNPDVLHSHYLNNARLINRLSEKTSIPFTLRTHSYDILHSWWRVQDKRGIYQPSQVAINAASSINNDNCLGILTFPYTVDALLAAGIHEDKITPCYPVVDFARFYDRGANGSGLLNVEPCLPKKAVTQFIDLAQAAPQYRYSLYGMGHQIEKVKQYNAGMKTPVDIFDPVEPEQMPVIYKAHDWLIYTASFKNGNMGWPLAVFEAQASGLGVCIANVHPTTEAQLGGAGFVYNSINDIPAIIAQAYPDEMRERGFENARMADIQRHKHLLTDLWDRVILVSEPPDLAPDH